MTELEQIGKKLPYAESPVYVDSLVQRCKAGALASAEHNKTRQLRPFAYALAACLAAAGVFLGVRLTTSRSPIDAFLAQTEDAEIALIEDFQIDEIPENYY